jgi:hypothetical protein
MLTLAPFHPTGSRLIVAVPEIPYRVALSTLPRDSDNPTGMMSMKSSIHRP